MAHREKIAKSNPSTLNSGYTSFLQPGNSPNNYRTSYGSDNLGRFMVTAPKGGGILKLHEGGNVPANWHSPSAPADKSRNPNRVAGVIGKVK